MGSTVSGASCGIAGKCGQQIILHATGQKDTKSDAITEGAETEKAEKAEGGGPVHFGAVIKNEEAGAGAEPAADADEDEEPQGLIGQARKQILDATEECATSAREKAAPVVDAGKAAYRFVYGDPDEENAWDDQVQTDGQQHVWTFQDQLSPEEFEELEAQAEAFHEGSLENHFISAMDRRMAIEDDQLAYEPPFELNWHLKFPPGVLDGANLTRLNDVPEPQIDVWRNVGLDSLEQGFIGVVILAGGDGSRLEGGDRASRFGFSPPTPMLDIGLLSRKSLFQIYCERIRRLHHMIVRRRVLLVDLLITQDPKLCRKRGLLSSSGKAIYPKVCTTPVYIMTSEDNHHDIEEFWASNGNFGIKDTDIYFFQQESWPSLGMDGKILMKNKFQFIRRPGGSGGVFKAMHTGGAIADMRARGLSGLFVMNCDNVLARVADPIFLGHCMSVSTKENDTKGMSGRQRAELVSVGLKTIERSDRDERLGYFMTKRDQRGKQGAPKDGGETTLGPGIPPGRRRAHILEHYEVTESFKRQDADKSHYHFYAADLCQYFFRIDEHLEQAIKHGVAWHAISVRTPHFSVKKGHVVKPPEDVLNGIRLEQVASGALQHSKRGIALHVDRFAEYAPVRSDLDAKTAVQTLGLLHQSWIRSAGGQFEDNRYASSKRDQRCEISPLVSYVGEDLAGLFDNGSKVDQPAKTKQATGGANETVKKITLPCHFDSGVEHMEGPAKHMDKIMATFADQVMYVPWASSAEQSTDAFGVMTQEQVKNVHADRGFAEHAAGGERLPITPRWLKDEEVHWEQKMKEKMKKFERMMELEALKGSKKWMNATNVEQLLEQYERDQADLVAERGLTMRRPRNKTMPCRPDRDEGPDALIRYGMPCYYKKEERTHLEVIEELEAEQVAAKALGKEGVQKPGSPRSASARGKKHHHHKKHHKK